MIFSTLRSVMQVHVPVFPNLHPWLTGKGLVLTDWISVHRHPRKRKPPVQMRRCRKCLPISTTLVHWLTWLVRISNENVFPSEISIFPKSKANSLKLEIVSAFALLFHPSTWDVRIAPLVWTLRDVWREKH